MKRSSKVLVAAIAVCLVLSSLAVDEGATLAPTSGPKSACKPGFEYNLAQNKCLEYGLMYEVAKCLNTTQLKKTNACFYEAMKCDEAHGEKTVQVINPLTQVSETKCEKVEDNKKDASKCDTVNGWTPTTKECTANQYKSIATHGCPTEYPHEVNGGCRHRVDLISEGLAIGQQPYCADADKYSVYQGFCYSKKTEEKEWQCGTGLKKIGYRCYEVVTKPFNYQCLEPGYELSGTECVQKSVMDTYLQCFVGTQNDTTGDCDNKVEVHPTKDCPPNSTYEEEAEEDAEEDAEEEAEEEAEEDMATNTNTPDEEDEDEEGVLGALEEVCRYVKTYDVPSCDGGAWDRNGMCL